MALRQSHDELSAIYDRMVDGLVVTDIETLRFVRANSSICQMLGYSEAELLSLSVRDIHPPEVVPEIIEKVRSAEQLKQPPSASLPVRRKDGSVFYAEVIGNFLVYDGRPCTMGIFRDITERRQAQAALERERRTLLHMLQASDHERQVIAYDIHDGLAQQLAAAVMQFQTHEHLRPQHPAKAATAYEAGVEMVRQAHFESRRLISGVRPPILDESGIAAAIAHLVYENSLEAGPKIELHSDVEAERLATILENSVYRIAQEALGNACKHSGSKKVKVVLVQEGEQYVTSKAYREGTDSCRPPRRRGRPRPGVRPPALGIGSSTTSKQNRLISGMLLRNGRTRAPAGMISSVETSSPTFSSTGTSSASGSGSNSGRGHDVRPLSQLHSAASSGGKGPRTSRCPASAARPVLRRGGTPCPVSAGR